MNEEQRARLRAYNPRTWTNVNPADIRALLDDNDVLRARVAELEEQLRIPDEFPPTFSDLYKLVYGDESEATK